MYRYGLALSLNITTRRVLIAVLSAKVAILDLSQNHVLDHLSTEDSILNQDLRHALLWTRIATEKILPIFRACVPYQDI